MEIIWLNFNVYPKILNHLAKLQTIVRKVTSCFVFMGVQYAIVGLSEYVKR